jgi:hypothetical protein
MTFNEEWANSLGITCDRCKNPVKVRRRGDNYFMTCSNQSCSGYGTEFEVLQKITENG